MNKKLVKELGQKVAEKRGHQWTPTSFLLDAFCDEERRVPLTYPDSSDDF
jgi:hypothetical protein